MAQLELVHIFFLLAVPLLGVILALPFWVQKSIVLVFLKMKRGVEELIASFHLKLFTKESIRKADGDIFLLTVGSVQGYFCTHLEIVRVTEWLRYESTSEGHLVQPNCSSKATYNQLCPGCF